MTIFIYNFRHLSLPTMLSTRYTKIIIILSPFILQIINDIQTIDCNMGFSIREMTFCKHISNIQIHELVLQQMILNNLGAILSKIKDLKPTFKIFIKSFQQQLQFIESIIEDDAEQIKNESKCCYCIIKKFNFSKKKFTKFQMFNPIFYKVFTLMTYQERQEYFLQLLNFIEELYAFYMYFIEKGKHEKLNLNKYKTKLQSKLIEKIISKTTMSILQKEQEQMRSFQVNTILNGVVHRKVGRFANYKLLLIEKVAGEEVKIIMDLRNYLILDYCQQIKSLYFYAIYETLDPVSICIQFIQEKSQGLSIFNRYLGIFQELMKIGKIEKLIQNIDLSELYKNTSKDANEHNLMMQTFLKNEEQLQESQNQNIFLNSEDIMKSTIKGKLKNVKRQQTIKAIDRYQLIKKKLIETLNILAEKRQLQNKKIQQFLNREAISQPKTKSIAVLKALKNTQSFVPRKKQSHENIEEQIKDIAMYFINQHKNQQSCLSIINNGALKQKKLRQKHDSFYTDCRENQSEQSKKFYQVFKRKGQVERKRQYKKNIYTKFYKQEYEFTFIQSLMDFIRVELTENIYFLPQSKIISESKNMKDEKLGKFKANWFEKLTKSVKIYCRKQSPTFLKIFIKVDIEIKSLVQALINIEAYPFWHPNIKKIWIKQAITSQNTIHYKIEIVNPLTNKVQTQQILLHLFKYQDKYYIIHKILADSEKQKQKTNKGMFNFFNFIKGSTCYSKISFLMIRISNITKNGFCQMVISLDYSPINPKYKDLAQKEAVSFFINFIFIKDYWKLKREEKIFGENIFVLDWNVSKKSFTNPSQQLLKQKDQQLEDNFQDLKMQKQLSLIPNIKKTTIQSSSQLIHSDQFFDM